MTGSNNFLQWNPAQNNIETDAQYLVDSMRLNGATAQIYPSNLHNKFAYQTTTFINALAQMLANKGYTVSDISLSSLISVFNSSLNNKEWLKSTTYAVGDVVGSVNLPQWAEAVCTTGGTTGTSEPTWGTTVGASITDGTATWLVTNKANNIAINQQIYSTAGTYTFTAPIDALYKVTVIGGGGGAGGAKSTSATYGAYSGGGGGGGTAIKRIYLTAGTTVSVTVGAGGAGGSITPTNGTAGGTTSFGSYCSATGGGFGILASATTIDAYSAVTSPGIGSSGDINIRGGAALAGIYVPSNAGSPSGGLGGSSYLSGMINGRATLNVTGISGFYGGGGGGVGAVNGSCVGGAGGDGVVMIEW